MFRHQSVYRANQQEQAIENVSDPQELSHEAAETVRQSQEISRQPIGSKQPYDEDGRYHTHADDWRGDALFILLSALHLCTRNILRRSLLHMLSIFPRPSKCGS
jgi:hypothetical protein